MVLLQRVCHDVLDIAMGAHLDNIQVSAAVFFFFCIHILVYKCSSIGHSIICVISKMHIYLFKGMSY